MGKRKVNVPHYSSGAARGPVLRYKRSGKTESQRVQENREAAAQVIALCFLVGLHDRYGTGKERLDRVQNAANGELDRFTLNKRAVGMERAKKKLNEELEGLYDGNFVLPVTKTPKTNRDWALLGEQRDAADIVVKCYALGTRKALGFGAERLAGAIKATEEVFREFASWAEGGDWFGYNMLARRMTAILGEPVDVDESGADEPIFGKTLD